MTKLLTIIFVFTCPWFAKAKEPQKPFFRSSEEIKFEFRTSNPMLIMGRDESFLGLVQRSDGSTNLQLLEVFQVPKAPFPLTEDFCSKLATKILDLPVETSMKLGKTEMFQGRSGQACETTVTDSKDPEAKERKIYVTGISEKTFALIAKFPKKQTPEDQTEIRAFIKTLKEN